MPTDNQQQHDRERDQGAGGNQQGGGQPGRQQSDIQVGNQKPNQSGSSDQGRQK